MREALAAIRDFSQNISWAWLALKRCFCFHSKGLLIPPQRPAYRRGEPVKPSRTVSSMDAGAELTQTYSQRVLEGPPASQPRTDPAPWLCLFSTTTQPNPSTPTCRPVTTSPNLVTVSRRSHLSRPHPRHAER